MEPSGTLLYVDVCGKHGVIEESFPLKGVRLLLPLLLLLLLLNRSGSDVRLALGFVRSEGRGLVDSKQPVELWHLCRAEPVSSKQIEDSLELTVHRLLTHSLGLRRCESLRQLYRGILELRYVPHTV